MKTWKALNKVKKPDFVKTVTNPRLTKRSFLVCLRRKKRLEKDRETWVYKNYVCCNFVLGYGKERLYRLWKCRNSATPVMLARWRFSHASDIALLCSRLINRTAVTIADGVGRSSSANQLSHHSLSPSRVHDFQSCNNHDKLPSPTYVRSKF